MSALFGGTLDPEHYKFDGSLAQAIEKAFNEVLLERSLTALSTGSDSEVQKLTKEERDDIDNRRMLYVAIARGVIRHLVANPDAFTITLTVGTLSFPASLAIQGEP